jgi:hypothetical protein
MQFVILCLVWLDDAAMDRETVRKRRYFFIPAVGRANGDLQHTETAYAEKVRSSKK